MAEAEQTQAAGARDSDSVTWAPPDPAGLNRCFEDYAVDSLISKNPRGAVYEGVQISLDRRVAIRLLAPEEADHPNFSRRFREEVRATGALEHPGITTIHDFGSVEIPDVGECFFVVMEFVPGDTLADRIQSGALEPEVALKMVAQICDALEFAHERGCVHGDIRPGNLLVTKDGGVKVGDFGLANATQTSEAGGLPRQAAPEVREDGDVDHRADIYSLGGLIFEMLTGAKLSESGASELSRVDSRLEKVVRKAMEEKPDSRYQQASEIRTEIETITRSLPVRRRRKRHWLAVAALVLAVATIAAFAFIRPETKPGKPSLVPGGVDILVTTNLDGEAVPGSLREAIAKAEDGDVIGFDPSLAGQTIRLKSTDGLLLEKSITIDASGLGDLLTIDGHDAKRVFMIFSKRPAVTLINLRITGGSSELEGAGIRNLGGDLTLVNCAIVNNTTRAPRGGGLFNTDKGSVTLENCLIAGNVSEQGGSGISNFGGKKMILKNCLITGNECVRISRHGCAVKNVNSSTLEMIHCTVVGNRESGVHSHESSNLLIENSIFADNRGFSDVDIYIRKRDGGGVETRGVNLVGNLDADVKSGDPPISADPRLGVLGEYGGQFPTMRPLPGSPAIDAAGESDLVSDARSLSRPIDGDGDGVARPDLGAVEFDPEGMDR